MIDGLHGVSPILCILHFTPTPKTNMFAKPPLLTVQQGKEGTFVSWLETLGLKDFIRRYSLPKLVEWGWLVPQYRIVFPSDYFLTWQDFPYGSSDRLCFGIEELLWDSTWHIDDDQEPSGFYIHSFIPMMLVATGYARRK